MRLHSFSDDDGVLAGAKDPAVPLSILANPSETWHTFSVVDADQRELEKQVEFLEDAITDLEDRLGQLDRVDEQKAFRTVDALEGCASRLSGAADELRRRL